VKTSVSVATDIYRRNKTKQNQTKQGFYIIFGRREKKGDKERGHDTRMRKSRLEGGLEGWQVEEGLGRVLSQTAHTL